MGIIKSLLGVRILRYVCPKCEHKLKPAEGFNVATQVIHRKCGRCHTRWQVIIKPVRLENNAGWADVAEFVKLERAA